MTDAISQIGKAVSPLITLAVLVIVLGAVISIVGAILYTVFSTTSGLFRGYRSWELEESEEAEPKKWDYWYEKKKLDKFLNTPSWMISRGKVKM